MRVLHLYSGNLYGGIEAMLAVLARERRMCPAMESHFGLCFDARLAGELRVLGAPVHILGDVRVRQPISVWRARRALRTLLATLKPEMVVCHSAWPYALFGGTVRAAHVPVGFWLHDAVRGTHWTERWARFRRPDIVIYNSEYTGRTVRTVFPRTRAELIHWPVSPPAPPPVAQGTGRGVRSEMGTAPGTVVIVQVGRLERWKGHPLLLHALGFMGDVPGWECWIVGGAQRAMERMYESQLRIMASSRGVRTRVHFLGERKDVQRVLADADIFCQPNAQAEPFGVAIIEALYAGIPVVATDMGGPSEILSTGGCGVLVPPANPHALANALRDLVTNHERRQTLGAAGPARAAVLCDPKARLNQLHDVLGDVVRQRSVR